jgi:hypothetical protein
VHPKLKVTLPINTGISENKEHNKEKKHLFLGVYLKLFWKDNVITIRLKITII